jgi:hypothetical protein
MTRLLSVRTARRPTTDAYRTPLENLSKVTGTIAVINCTIGYGSRAATAGIASELPN